jgi:hypothetical protein
LSEGSEGQQVQEKDAAGDPPWRVLTWHSHHAMKLNLILAAVKGNTRKNGS